MRRGLDDGHLPGPARRPRRRRRARDAAGEIDAIAKAFPHIRARDARLALQELPELRASGLAEHRLDLMFRLVERLDGCRGTSRCTRAGSCSPTRPC